jgi:threonine dehydrogenase-like Zn-dependent dehydrogenase
VLVKTLACGICGSDLHARKHAHRMVELAKHFPGRKPMDLSRDVVFGHEFCCEILDYGPDTTRKLKAGTKVCSLPALLTPQGPQGIGYSNDNVGAYAERMLLSEALLLEVPNGLAAGHAALTEPLAVGVHAVAKANIRGDEVPLVIGCGPVGLAVIAGLKIRGLHPIVAADYSPARRRLAEKLGADIVVDPARSLAFATWAEHAQMSPEEKAARPPLQAMLPALKPALIFECVGIPGLLQQVFEGAPRDARIVVVGVCMETDRSEPMLGIMKELNVQYVLGYTPLAAPDRGRRGRCGVDGDGARQHRWRGAGIRRSRQSGSAHQDNRGAVAVAARRLMTLCWRTAEFVSAHEEASLEWQAMPIKA